jgi:hypothetical protein
MKSRYDRAPGKEAAIAKVRQNRYEGEQKANDEFVKRVEAEQSRHGGRIPNINPEMMDFCSYMSNNGEHAQELARDITKGMDKVAFPLK